MAEPIKKKRGRKSKKELEELKKIKELQELQEGVGSHHTTDDNTNIELNIEENNNVNTNVNTDVNTDVNTNVNIDVNTDVNIEKKDGVNEVEYIVQNVPKKRGRKPKIVSESDKSEIPIKRRGRKAKEKAYGKDNNIQDLVQNENIIVHLPIKENNDNFTDGADKFSEESLLQYDPNIGVPAESETTGLKESDHSWIESHDNLTENDQSLLLDKGPPPENKFACYPFNQNKKKTLNNLEKKKIDHTMKMFKDYNTEKEWPSKTDIHCFWDCGEIEGQPFGLPIKYVGGVYYLIGCFSTPECAAAYNFNDSSISNPWYNYSLLNMMCRDMFNNPKLKIKVAPQRQCLQKFGGNLSLKEFREICMDYTKDYKIVFPPVISVIPLQEEVSIRKQEQSRNKNVPVVMNEEKSFKLARKKPLKNFEFTLDNCMNLQYNN